MPHAWRDLRRDVCGNVPRDLCDVRGDLPCDLRGNVRGNVPGYLRGDLRRNVPRDLRGDLRGNVPCDVRPRLYARAALRAADRQPASVSISIGDLHPRRAELPAARGGSGKDGRRGTGRLRGGHDPREHSDRMLDGLSDALRDL